MAALVAGGACAAGPSARAMLSGVRCIYSPPHDESGRRMELQVVVTPTEPGWRVNEAGSRALSICGTDQNGNILHSSPCTWGELAENPEARSVVFIFPLPGRVDYLDVDEVLQVQITRDTQIVNNLNINLLKPAELQLPGEKGAIRSIPAESNSIAENRDVDGTLLRADLTFICPAGVSISRVVRVWSSPGDAINHAQDLEVRHFTTARGEDGTRIVLWNVEESERMQLELCTGQSTVRVPVRFRATLGKSATHATQTGL